MGPLFRSAVAFFLFAIASIQSANAEIDPVDVAVDAAVIAGMVAGVPITSDQAGFAKELIRCMADGNSLAECVQQAIVKAALANTPDEAKDFAACIASGKKVTDCVTEEVLKHVPEEARPLVQCVMQGNTLATCAAQFVAGQIDEVTKKALDDAMAQLKKLQADTGDLPNIIKNLLLVVEGIEKSEPEKIILGGGPEIYKAVVTIILNILLTPALQPLIGPIVDEVVQNRVDLARDILKAANEGDAVELGRIVFEFYLTMHFEAPCAALPKGEFKDAVCGNLAKAVHAVADAAADVVDELLDLAEDILKEIGLYQLGDKLLTVIGDLAEDFVDTVGGWLGIGDDNKPPRLQPPEVCGTAGDYFAANFLTCLTTAADAKSRGSYANLSSAMVKACTDDLGRCYSNAAQACQAMADSINGMADALAGALAQAADAYAKTMAGAFALANASAACEPDFWQEFGYDFIEGCTKALGQNVPWDNGRCPSRGLVPLPVTQKTPWKVCEAALNKLNFNAVKPPQAVCDDAKREAERLNQAKINCLPTGTTADGKVYQMSRPPLGNERAMAEYYACIDAELGIRGNFVSKRADFITSVVRLPGSQVPDPTDVPVLRFRPFKPFESGGGYYLVKGEPEGGVARKKPATVKSPDALRVPGTSSSSTNTVMPSSTHSTPRSKVNRAMAPGLLEGGSSFNPQGPAAAGSPSGVGVPAIGGGGSGTVDYGGCGGCGSGGGAAVLK